MNTQPPQHIAIICDGNRRWARQHGLEVFLGHQKATQEVFEPLLDHAAELGIKYVTFWIFSTENWSRAEQEVQYLLDLFREMFDTQILRLHEKNYRVKTIGDISRFSADIQERIKKGTALTEKNTGLTVIFAMNYGGRDELVRAVNAAVQEKNQSTTNQKNVTLSAADIEAHLDTAGIPDPDLIIRTSGEQRMSGFLLWQSNYSEFSFPEFYFPEFTPEKLDEVLQDFSQRKRRFGK